MNLALIVIGVWFILWGINALGLMAVSNGVLGILALIGGIAIIVLGVNAYYERRRV